jgi:hypothetical protein
VKLISIPAFRKSKSIILMDLETLQCYEMKFELSEGVLPLKENECPSANKSDRMDIDA